MISLSRRNVTAGIGMIAASSASWARRASALPVAGPSCSVADGATVSPKVERAVSLRQLLESNPLPDAYLPGLTRLDGYVETGDDLILWGRSEAGRENLRLGDFVLALQLVLKAGSHGQWAPLISIDPDNALLQEALEVDATTSDGRRRFEALCGRPQTVRVEGMPRNSRLTKILVEADYRMKMVAQGRVHLPISPPIKSTFDTRWDESRKNNESNSEGKSTRYWFQAGDFSYQKDKYTIFLEKASVILNTEDQIFKTGNSSGGVDRVASNFTCEWTSRMDEISSAEPIWRDLINVFRHFAVARAFATETNGGQRTASEFLKLISSFKIEEINLPDTLPGLSRMVTTKNIENQGKKRFINTIQYKVCGGVSMAFERGVKAALG